MPEINPLTNNQIFLKKIAENTGSNYETGDVSEINPLTIDQIFLKEIAANTAGQSGDITELEAKVADNTEAIEATQDMISDAYDPTATYDAGDYCIYNDTLYKCNTAIATGEAFTPAKWDATTVTGELRPLKYVTKSLTIDNGDVTLFDRLVDIVGIRNAQSGYWAAIPYYYGSNTCAKIIDFSLSVPTYATGTSNIQIWYRER